MSEWVVRPKDQGTRWESELVRRAQDIGILAGRLAEGGITDQGDVWLLDTPDSELAKVAVAWKRLTGEGSRRTPDGERDVVILRTDDFLELLWALDSAYPYCWVVEAKATQNLNVTRVLAKAWKKVRG